LDSPGSSPQDESIADLVGRLVDNGRDVARAEIGVYKAIARHRAGRAKSGLVALVAAGILGWFAFTALIFGIVLALAIQIGPLGAGAAVATLLGIGAWLLLRFGLSGVRALGGDEEEREALRRGETVL
jgi:hypothetical protein